MTSTVTKLTHCVDKAIIARLFARFKSRYGHLWSSRAANDEEWEFVMDDWLQELSKFTLEQVRAAVIKALTTFKEFPPTLGQLVDLCLKENGTPSLHDVIRLMVARDFSHPLVKMVYDKIGSWTLKNGKEEEINRKAKEHYTECLAQFQIKPEQAWMALEHYNEKPKELAPPPKMPSPEERKGFKERMTEFQKKLDDEKLNCKGKTYKEFDAKAVNPYSHDFKPEVYEEFKQYLLSIPDDQTMILPVEYIYQRMQFIGKMEQKEYLLKAGYNPSAKFHTSEPQRNGKSGPKPIYKAWAGD
ncbi:MAG TPA: hypothetical protein VEA37_00215 [Flavobacterium sp.]|nr:hypothetical protein [Flavobacterium sp.]